MSNEVEETKLSSRYKAMKVCTPKRNIFVSEYYYPVKRTLGLITVAHIYSQKSFYGKVNLKKHSSLMKHGM